MLIWLELLLFAVGIALIVKGGDFFVDSASWIAEVSGIPKFIVGATIVSVATTLPEMIVSIMASINGNQLLLAGDAEAASGQFSMAVGNAVGSVTANTGLILSIAILFMNITIPRKQNIAKVLMLIGAVAMVWGGSLIGDRSNFSVIASIVLIIIFALYVADSLRSAKTECSTEERPEFTKKECVFKSLFFVLGAVMLVIGSRLLIDHGTNIAHFLNVPEEIIAITMIAIGTSLPELVTTITAIIKKQSSLSAGNIIGANILDLSLILPVSSLASGNRLEIPEQSYMLDMPACLIIILAAMVPSLFTQKLQKWQGVLMLALYAGYLAIAMTAFA